ncbi:MAG: deoxyribose-phosphate aldolase [Planctomycetota bacterium]
MRSCNDVARMIDHSLLRPELTQEDVREGCEVARKYNVASVCCAPAEVALVKELPQRSDVKTTTVIGFPRGYNKTLTKAFEAEQAIKDGAVELDMVLNVSRLLSGNYDYVKSDIQAVVEVAHRSGVLVKVILENYYLTDERKKTAVRDLAPPGLRPLWSSATGGVVKSEPTYLCFEEMSRKYMNAVRIAVGVCHEEPTLSDAV